MLDAPHAQVPALVIFPSPGFYLPLSHLKDRPWLPGAPPCMTEEPARGLLSLVFDLCDLPSGATPPWVQPWCRTPTPPQPSGAAP